MSDPIIVSNGDEFCEIGVDDLALVASEGFYRPDQHGMTIVGDGQLHFQIPLCDLPAARAHGLANLLPDLFDDDVASIDVEQISDSEVPAIAATAAIDAAQGSDRFDLLSELDSAEQAAQQDAQEQQEELESTTGLGYYVVWLRQWAAARQVFLERQLGSHGISIAIHVAIFLLLASLVLVDDRQQKSVIVASMPSSSDVVEEIIIEPESLEITEPTDTESEDSPPESEAIEVAVTETVAMDFMGAVSAPTIKPPAVASKTDGQSEDTPKTTSAVFGTKTTANDYVFVIDNSNSMSNGRFETALHELMVAVNGLNKKQRFYVIFYSDTAYRMMHPNPVTQMAYATRTNKQQLFQWLNTVPLCLKTNGKEAIQTAFDMDPDVIYVLGDGAFNDGASKHFAKVPRGRTLLNTRGMQVSPGLAKSFEQLAKAHGGDYKDVGVVPAAKAMAKQYPRPRLNVRSGVWGLKLPAK